MKDTFNFVTLVLTFILKLLFSADTSIAEVKIVYQFKVVHKTNKILHNIVEFFIKADYRRHNLISRGFSARDHFNIFPTSLSATIGFDRDVYIFSPQIKRKKYKESIFTFIQRYKLLFY